MHAVQKLAKQITLSGGNWIAYPDLKINFVITKRDFYAIAFLPVIHLFCIFSWGIPILPAWVNISVPTSL